MQRTVVKSSLPALTGEDGGAVDPDNAEETLRELAMLLSRRLPVYYEASLARLALEADLPQLDLRALVFIIEFGALTTGHLGQLMGISHGGVTAMVDRLEEGGYIFRDRDERDRRVVILRPVEDRCEALIEPELYMLGRLNEIARQAAAGEVVDAYELLTRCVKVFRRDTAQWLENKELAR